MSKDELMQEYIAALYHEIAEWKCAVSHLQRHKDGWFPDGNLKKAITQTNDAKARFCHKIEEEQLNAISP